MGIRLSDAPRLPAGQRTAWLNYLAPGWFETYGMRVLAGRDFALSDARGAEPVAVVNEAFVRRFAGGQNVLGRRVMSATPGGLDARIVGVVNDSVYRMVRIGVVPTMYLPILQGNYHGSAFSVTAKLTSPRARVEQAVTEAIARSSPDLSFTFREYGDQLRATIIQERLIALMSGFFGGLAMLLAALGVYGVTAYTVGRRRGEIAIRMALGSSAPGVVRLVLGRVASMILVGAVVGVTLSLWATRFVSALLYGVEARDPLTIAAAAGVLVSVGLFAGWLPARKVSRLDPTAVLRT
jgi:ABC-type antimicrobial peptide transport system permease subunit